MVLSADPVNMSPCVGMSATAHTAASCPFNVITLRWLSHTLAVVSQEPLSRVPNLPAANVHTVKVGGEKRKYNVDLYQNVNFINIKHFEMNNTL